MKFNGPFHMMQFGGFFCEIIGGSLFLKNKAFVFLAIFLITIFMPIIFIALCCIIVAMGIIMGLEWINKKAFGNKIKNLFKKRDTYNVRSRLKRFYIYLLNVIKVLIIIAAILLLVGASVVIGSALGVVLLPIMIIMYFVVLVCLFINWRRRNVV